MKSILLPAKGREKTLKLKPIESQIDLFFGFFRVFRVFSRAN